MKIVTIMSVVFVASLLAQASPVDVCIHNAKIEGLSDDQIVKVCSGVIDSAVVYSCIHNAKIKGLNGDSIAKLCSQK